MFAGSATTGACNACVTTGRRWGIRPIVHIFQTAKEKKIIGHRAHNLVNADDEVDRESQSNTMESRMHVRCEEGPQRRLVSDTSRAGAIEMRG
jgi:hypothetical protein